MTLAIDDTTPSQDTQNEPTKELSYFYRLQELICKMTDQLSRLSAESSRNMDEKKKEFRACSATAADLIDKKGNFGPWGAAASLAITIGSASILGVEKVNIPHMQQIIGTVTGQIIPQLAGCYTSHLDSEQMRKSQIANLRQTDISNDGAKSGDTVSISSSLDGLKQALLEIFRKASS